MASPKYTAKRRVLYMDPDTRKMVAIKKDASFEPPTHIVEGLVKQGAIVPYVEPDVAEATNLATQAARAERAKAQNAKAAQAKQNEVRAADINMGAALSTDSDAVRSVPGKSVGSNVTHRG
jgi:hypothetical protein